MSLFLTVLGSSSATPTAFRYPSAYLLRSDRMKSLMLIDCGEGTQMQLRRNSVCMQKIEHIFISHLHGDHFFGLFGFIFSQNLLGRKDPLHIYAHKPLKELINNMLSVDGTQLQYEIVFHAIKDGNSTLLKTDRMIVKAFPLNHSIKTHGFVFTEQGPPYVLDKDFVNQYHPSKEWMEKINNGADYETEDGIVLPHAQITRKVDNLKSFAYCSDTAYSPEVVKKIKGVDLLYHEATFMHDLAAVATDKYHSTSQQAAEIAKAARVKKLLVGHFSARYKDINPLVNEAKEVFANTSPAIEGMVVKA